MQVFTMSCCSKEKIDRNDYNNTCKSQSTKSDREMYRICPSKLSKRELEDLYFTLLENNLELKKTINAQDDKIRVLSTQVHRMNNSNGKRMSKEMKECSTTKAFVNEQKDFIAELKETNRCMAERIEQLNMKLSSAKQFAKTTLPLKSNARTFRPATASPPKKHNCLTKDQDNEQVIKLSVSTQWEDKTPRKHIHTQTPIPLEKKPLKADQPCDENKCKSLMEELKVKIVTLQEELFNVHDEYSTRIGRLETEVSEVRKENVRISYERTASEHELQNTVKRTSDVLAQYRLTEAKCSELGTQLAIEKRRVAELETLLKAANMSDKVNKTIEDHLTTIQTLPPLTYPQKRRELEDPNKTKYSASKCSSSTSQQVSKSSPTKTISEVTNCETCGCKPQLTSDPAHSFTPTPADAKGEDVECRCPSWVKSGILKSSSVQTQEVNSPCIKCCFKDKHGATESPLSKNGKFVSPRGAPTKDRSPTKVRTSTKDRSPIKDKDSTKSSQTGDDSGYQDTEEADLLKQNRELMTRILELQNQVDRMKIQMPEAKPGKISESTGSPKITRNNAAGATAVAAVPLFGTLKKEKIPVEQIVCNKCTEGGNYEMWKQVPVTTKVSDEHVRETGKILGIEILGNPKEAERTLNKDDTRAKTDVDGSLKITEEASDQFSPLELMNDDYRENYKTDSHKLKIIEKKHEIPGSSKPESGNISPKSAISDVLGPRFNPEKLKYLEAEGIIAKELRDDMSNLKEVSSSPIESIPSNPELGFGIPRLASKTSQDKYKAKSDFGQAKKSPAVGRYWLHQARDDMEDLHGNLKLPMTEALIAKNLTALKQTDETKKKEDCEYCAACSFDKECELKHENATNHRMNKFAPEMQKEQPKKQDQHNILQKPGPILTSDNSKREENRNLCCHCINPKTDEKQTTTTDGPANQPDVPLLDKGDDSKDAVEPKHSKIVFSMNSDLDPPLLEVRMPTYRPHSERMLPTLLPPSNRCGKATQVERKADVAQSTDQKLAEKSTPAPTNIADSGRPQCVVSLYRRRSGTLRYRTVPASPRPPVCRCPDQQDGYCTDKPRKKVIQAHDKEEVKSPRDQPCCGRAVLTSERGTYTVNSKQTGTSPDNTDLEMSYLSDLPMEKEKKRTFKSRPVSPGEDRTTTFTNTYSYYSPPTSMSEGEMPATTSKPKHTVPYVDRPYLNTALAHKLETPQAQQMEAALHAISEELRRCRNMMHSHRPAERYQRAAQTTSLDITPPIALRPGVATQGIGDTFAPMSIFTLHIGTIVFSDEAVLNSADKNLVLRWKFYDQAVTMARMHTGRVMVFDFSTEYDIKVTEDFLRYLKHEEMPIIICEVDQEEAPFAACVLPLRDALLHTNTRADMSLALMAGPQMLKERAKNAGADKFDTGDEVGVIDLWCLMRADANMLPGINLAIAQPMAAPNTVGQRRAGVMPQVLDDYNELDLSMSNIQPVVPLDPTGRNQTYGNLEYNRTSNTWGYGRNSRPKEPIQAETSQTTSYDPSKYPPIRERKLRAPVTTSTPQIAPHKQYDFTSERQRQSEMIMNEVNPMIKSPGDIRLAVEKSNRLNDSRARPNRTEDDSFSQQQTSYTSLRSVLTRLQKRGSRITNTHGGDQRSFIEKLRKASRTGDAPTRNLDTNEATVMEKYMKYENIGKGANKAEQSKKVTILPKYVSTNIEQSIGDQVSNKSENQQRDSPKFEITVLWLALNEECEAMVDPYVQRVYIAYNFLGRSGAELETPISLPKPKHYVDKCYFNFKKVFELSNSDLLKLGHMARCHAAGRPEVENEEDCIIFSVVSEPADDPLGLESCVDIGYAYLYLGDMLEYSSGSPGYTEVTPVRAARGPEYVCGVLAVRLDGLDVVRRCLLLTPNEIA